MRVLFLSVILTGCVVAGLLGEPCPGQRTVLADTGSDAKLQLTTTLLDARYCSRTHFELRLRLDFTNVGKRQIILYKNSSVIGAYMISRDERSAEQKKYEINVAPMKTFSSSGLQLTRPDESMFTILDANQVHSIETTMALPISRTPDIPSDYVGAGDHVLQLNIWTWYYQPPMAQEYRKKWSRKGYLWSTSVLSSPMPFTIASKPQVVNCQEP